MRSKSSVALRFIQVATAKSFSDMRLQGALAKMEVAPPQSFIFG
jgi:hypothetical protein